MDVMVKIVDQIDIDMMQKVADENNITIEGYIQRMIQSFIDNRVRDNYIHSVKNMKIKEIRAKLKENK